MLLFSIIILWNLCTYTICVPLILIFKTVKKSIELFTNWDQDYFYFSIVFIYVLNIFFYSYFIWFSFWKEKKNLIKIFFEKKNYLYKKKFFYFPSNQEILINSQKLKNVEKNYPNTKTRCVKIKYLKKDKTDMTKKKPCLWKNIINKLMKQMLKQWYSITKCNIMA